MSRTSYIPTREAQHAIAHFKTRGIAAVNLINAALEKIHQHDLENRQSMYIEQIITEARERTDAMTEQRSRKISEYQINLRNPKKDTQ